MAVPQAGSLAASPAAAGPQRAMCSDNRHIVASKGIPYHPTVIGIQAHRTALQHTENSNQTLHMQKAVSMNPLFVVIVIANP